MDDPGRPFAERGKPVSWAFFRDVPGPSVAVRSPSDRATDAETDPRPPDARPWVARSFERMYAIFEDGSHQFRVREGDRIVVDRRDGEPGERTRLPQGPAHRRRRRPDHRRPRRRGARVVAKIVNQFRDKKIIIQKFRRRKNMRRRNGHRQPYTTVQITSIAPGLSLCSRSHRLPNHSNRPVPDFPASGAVFVMIPDRFRSMSVQAPDREPPLNRSTRCRRWTEDAKLPEVLTPACLTDRFTLPGRVCAADSSERSRS